jgi:PAS domain S-box-containing protein
MNQPAKILVADTKPAFLSDTRRLFASAGYIPLTARSGAQTLQLVAEHKPDLVLVDARLPDISGFAVCKQIKTNAHLRGIFVVILSARKTGSSSQSEELDTGADEYITRPISRRELLARAQALLRIHSAELALRQSEELFRTMTNYTQDWEYWVGPDQEFIYISPSCEVVSGYPAREYRELPDLLKKIIHPVDLAAFLEHDKTTFQSRQPGSLEMRIITRSGDVRWIQHICQPVYDVDGKWQGQRVSNRDITGRKMVVEILEKQNRTLRFIQEIAQEINGELEISALLHNIMQRAVDLSRADRGGGIYLFEPDKNLLRLVEGAGINQERVGITVGIDEGVAGHVFRTKQPFVVENYTLWEEHAAVLVNSPPSTVMGIPLLIKGEVIGVLTLIANSMMVTFTEEDTRLAGMFAAQASIAIQNAQSYGKAEQEIIERKQAEKIIRESEARFRSIYENSDDAILLTALDGKVYAANPAACRMFGRSEAEICQVGREGLVDSRDPRLFTALEMRQSSGHFRGELTYLRRNGQPFPGEITSTVFQEGGEARTSMIIRDMSERKQAEDALRQSNEKLELLFEILPVGVSVLDQENRVIKSNQALENILDLSKEDLQNRVYNHRRYIRPDGTQMPAEEFPSRRILQGEKIITGQEIGIVKEDGSFLWTSVSAISGPSPDWRVVLVTSVITRI